MKNYYILSVAIGLLFLSSFPALSQLKHRGPKDKGLEQLTTVSGTVVEWTYNDDFVYDGLNLLSENNRRYFVKFPPHLGEQMMSVGKVLTVNGVLKYNREGEEELKLMDATGNGKTIYDQKPQPRAIPVQETFVNDNSEIAEVQINKHGDACGYIMKNGTILKIPPHVARQLMEMVKPGDMIGYTGVLKRLKEGHVQSQDYQIVRCQTISVNGTQYVVK